MKRTIFATLGALAVIAAVAPAAAANEIAAKSEPRLTRTAYTPHNLVHAAYNGNLEGIPSYGLLRSAIASRDVEAKDLVEAAIAQGRLTEGHLEDRGFLNAVKFNLEGLNTTH